MASEHNSVAVSFRTDPAMHANLMELAHHEGLTVSTLCRRLIEQALKQHAQGARGGMSGRIASIRSRAKRRMVGRAW